MTVWDCDRALQVCTTIIASHRQDIKPDSSLAVVLESSVQQQLLRYGIAVNGCDEAQLFDREVILNLKKIVKKTPDGYGIVTGQLQGEVSARKGKGLGHVRSSKRVNGTVYKANNEILVTGLLSEQFIEQLAVSIVSYP